MASKLGIHVNEQMYAEKLNEFVAIAKPRAMLHLNLGDAETPRIWADSSPDTDIVFRKWYEGQPLNDPEEKADRMIRSIEDSSCGREGVIKICSGYNEIGPHLTHDYSRFDIRAAQRAHDLGWKYVAGSWSVGCPGFDSWESNWMDPVLESCDFMGIHEY